MPKLFSNLVIDNASVDITGDDDIGVRIKGGDEVSGSAGNVALTAGVGGTTGTGGEIDINAGAGGSTSGDGGPINIDAGAADGGGVGGAISLTAGLGIGTNAGGAINLTAGAGGVGAGGDGGAVVITAGDAGAASAGDGGDIELRPGALDGAGTDGVVRVIGATAGAGVLQLEDDAGGDFFGLTVPSSITTSYTLTMPAALGSGGLLSFNGSGIGTFVSGAASLSDADGDTLVQVEEAADEDIVRMDVGPGLIAGRNAQANAFVLGADQFTVVLPGATAANGNLVGAPVSITAGAAVSGDGGSVSLAAGDSSLFDGGAVTITAGDAIAEATGGAINLTAGDGSVAGGAVNITAGDSPKPSGPGGAVVITGGNSIIGPTVGAGGTVSISGGDGQGTNGGFTISGGDVLDSGASGTTCTIDSGTASGDGDVGELVLRTNNATAGGGFSGNVLITAGDNGTGGALGRSVIISAGDAGSGTGGNGGDIDLTPGDGDGAGNNGSVVLGNGSEAAPSIVFTSDLDTGLYNPTGDVNSIGVVTGGVEAERVYGAFEDDATGAATTVLTIPITSGDSAVFEVFAVAREDSATDSAVFRIFGGVENTGGTAALIGSTTKDRTDDGGAPASWDVTVGVTGGSMTVSVDSSTETVDWKVKVKLTEL